ncbi:MAG: carbamoyltransferase HypF, partial [Planctomycetes bacterium]|nr:carbamoyltransferase HypF [Planctomycetota bacterium]
MDVESVVRRAIPVNQPQVTRRRIVVTGIVQGVGFRPYVYLLARRHHLTGWVLNSSQGVEIEVEGPSEAIECFIKALPAECPPLARVSRLRIRRMAAKGDREFVIRESAAGEAIAAFISPDVATCADCLRELLDPNDRRYRYPFINCTNCGPRYTILQHIPYDRPNTTMRVFKMCPACQAEYDDPSNRRFHAQPNACWDCGPRLQLLDAAGQSVPSADPIAEAQKLLAEGKTVALKGLGGFHLSCDATNDAAVRRLRERKRREEKPFAVMSADLEAVRQYCEVSEYEAKLLSCFQRPIVLLRKRVPNSVAPAVAPSNRRFGVMLPYTPIHHILLADKRFLALVMTSGNLTDEPIAIDNAEAVQRLSGIADAFLVHNRDIGVRSDDSVTRVRGYYETLVIRRARGYAPEPVLLRGKSEDILAVGPELKNTIC